MTEFQSTKDYVDEVEYDKIQSRSKNEVSLVSKSTYYVSSLKRINFGIWFFLEAIAFPSYASLFFLDQKEMMRDARI